jgi:hypothetical protein
MKFSLLISVLAVSLNACGVDTVDTTIDPMDLVEDEGPHHEKLAANGMSPDMLDATSIPVAKLTQSYADTMSATAAGRHVMTYLVGCALGSGVSQSSTYVGGDGNTYPITYHGSIGLHSTWKGWSPSLAQQRAISGCVLSRMNESGASLTISIRGALYANDAGETTNYAVREGAFFGNVFNGGDNYWGSCDYTSAATHPQRQCSQEGHCNMSWAGSCASACTLSSGNYTCTANGITYPTATVYLNAADF